MKEVLNDVFRESDIKIAIRNGNGKKIVCLKMSRFPDKYQQRIRSG